MLQLQHSCSEKIPEKNELISIDNIPVRYSEKCSIISRDACRSPRLNSGRVPFFFFFIVVANRYVSF